MFIQYHRNDLHVYYLALVVVLVLNYEQLKEFPCHILGGSDAYTVIVVFVTYTGSKADKLFLISQT